MSTELVGGARRRFLLPLALAQFICSFAGSNMNVMINDISEDLDTTVQGVQLAITLFLLIMAIFMIPASKLTDRWGRKRCFIGGLALLPGGLKTRSRQLWRSSRSPVGEGKTRRRARRPSA